MAEIETPAERPGCSSAWHLYVVRLAMERLSIDRDRVALEMAARNIGTSVHFRPVHLHRYWRERYDFRSGGFPVAEDAGTRVLSLPLHPSMTDRDADDAAEALLDVIARHRR